MLLLLLVRFIRSEEYAPGLYDTRALSPNPASGGSRREKQRVAPREILSHWVSAYRTSSVALKVRTMP